MVPDIGESTVVNDVLLVNLRSHSDDRGRFTEIFRKEWFPGIDWTIIQSNRSDSQAGVLRGLHYHHKQVDYWYVVKGSIRAGLVDLRKSSRVHVLRPNPEQARRLPRSSARPERKLKP